MIMEFSIRPMWQSSKEPVTTGETETVDGSQAGGPSRSMRASIEGSWDEVMSVIRGCHEAHANGHPRVVTTIVVVDDSINGRLSGWPRVLHDIVAPVQDQLGNGAQQVRRIPVEFHESVTR